MTDISKNWYDLSLNSNILKSTYVTGILDVSNNIVGQGNLWINNEKDEGNSCLGIGTNNPVNSINIQANEPCIDFTNSTITGPTNNNQQIGKIDFLSPIRGNATSGSIRCENLGDDYDNNGSLIFARSNSSYDVVFFSSGNVGIGTTNAHQLLHVNGGIEFIMSNNAIGGVHCSGDLGLTTDVTLYITSKTKIVFGSGSSVNTSTNPSFNMNSVSPTKTNMVVTSDGVGINTSAPRKTLDVNGYMRVTDRLYVKYSSSNSTYSGWSKNVTTNEGTSGWNITSGGTDYGGRAVWFGRSSITIDKGLWILFGYLDVARHNNASGSVGIETIGVGLGTNTIGNNLAAKMYHIRGTNKRMWYSYTNDSSNYARFTVCRAFYASDDDIIIYLGVILGTNNVNNLGLNTKLQVWRISNRI